MADDASVLDDALHRARAAAARAMRGHATAALKRAADHHVRGELEDARILYAAAAAFAQSAREAEGNG